MDLNNYTACKVCGKLYLKVMSGEICPECRESEDKFFKEVKEYLYENPDASIQEVIEQTGAPSEFIDSWIKEGRLESTGLAVSHPCEICGATITKGRVCSRCKSDLGDIKKGIEDGKVEKPSRSMYITEKNKQR